MYPGTKFNWYDASQFSTTTGTVDISSAPLFLTAFSADKGTEEMIRVAGDDFYKMYGKNLSFAKHGQVLLQAGRIIDTGAELLCKRIVSESATLSNLILCIQLTGTPTQKTNADGDPLYIDNTTGDETTEAETGGQPNNPIMYTVNKIKWIANTVENCKTFDEVKEAVDGLYVAYNEDSETGIGTGTWPIYVVADIGRNADCKAIRILPDYSSSKSLGIMVYEMADIEGTQVSEKVTFTANSRVIINNVSYAVNEYMMGQLKLDEVDGMLEEYTQQLADNLGMDYNDLINMDMLFGAAQNGASLENVSIDADGVDITNEYGITLKSGSDGIDGFLNSEEYTDAMVGFFLGEDTDAIFDVDVHKVRAVVDANYPVAVKEAIATLANFREDFFFFRDLGVGLTTYNAIVTAASALTKTKFAGDYMTSYKVIDPLTRKRIDVTMMYDFVVPLINHFINGAEVPLAGESNNFILSSAIQGTLNYTPVNTIRVNQKDLLDDARINYATYYEYGGNLVVESLYTSQEATTQLSYINNVLAIQEVMRALRSGCPKNRFKFQSGNDFSDYEDACTEILQAYKSWFSKLEFVYTQDDIRATQKIFYASINFAFNNWVQTEIFDLYALPTVTTETT
jgi:hypothetical protein